MILSSCHDYSLNNDCRCHCHCHYMQRIYVYCIMSCLVLPCLAYNNNSNTSPLKRRQNKSRQDDVLIDSLHIMTTTMTTTMKIIIQ